MKKKIGELNGKPIVTASSKVEVRKNEILYLEKNNKVALKVKLGSNLQDITLGGNTDNALKILYKTVTSSKPFSEILNDLDNIKLLGSYKDTLKDLTNNNNSNSINIPLTIGLTEEMETNQLGDMYGGMIVALPWHLTYYDFEEEMLRNKTEYNDKVFVFLTTSEGKIFAIYRIGTCFDAMETIFIYKDMSISSIRSCIFNIEKVKYFNSDVDINHFYTVLKNVKAKDSYDIYFAAIEL